MTDTHAQPAEVQGQASHTPAAQPAVLRATITVTELSGEVKTYEITGTTAPQGANDA